MGPNTNKRIPVPECAFPLRMRAFPRQFAVKWPALAGDQEAALPLPAVVKPVPVVVGGLDYGLPETVTQRRMVILKLR